MKRHLPIALGISILVLTGNMVIALPVAAKQVNLEKPPKPPINAHNNRRIETGMDVDGSPKTKKSLESSIKKLLKKSPEEFGLDGSLEWKLTDVYLVPHANKTTQTAYVHFVQVHDGLEVEGSRVSLTIKVLPNKTKIMNTHVTVFPEVKNVKSSVPKKSPAKSKFKEKLKGNRRDEDILDKGEKIKFIEGKWRKVQEFADQQTGLVGAVDDSGELFIWDGTIHQTYNGIVSGDGYRSGWGRTTDSLSLRNLKVKGNDGGADVYTDQAGAFQYEGANASDPMLTTTLEGKWAKIRHFPSDSLNLTRSQTASPTNSNDFNFDGTSEESIAQVNGYYHTDYVHNWLAERIPGFSNLDRQVTVYVNKPHSSYRDYCNASYGSRTMNFYVSYLDDCSNTSKDNIIYHEYGHFLDDMAGGMYRWDGQSEGWGDVVSSFIRDNALVVEGFSNQIFNQPPRRVDGAQKYDPSGNTEEHTNGLAWAGFAWNLRGQMISAYGEMEGKARTENLIIPTVLANADTIPHAIKEVLLADDDDGLISNGTPHYDMINSAASRHGINLGELFILISTPSYVYPPGDSKFSESMAHEIRPQEKFSVHGTISLPGFTQYTVEWHSGSNPGTKGWSSNGVTLPNNGTQEINNSLIATWNPPSATLTGYYTLRIRITANGQTSEKRIVIYFNPSIKTGKWPVRTNASSGEISYRKIQSGVEIIRSGDFFDKAGNIILTTPGSSNVPASYDFSTAAGDTTLLSDGRTLVQSDHSIKNLQQVLSGANQSVFIDDLNNDGEYEYISAFRENSNERRIYVLNSDGTFFNENIPLTVEYVGAENSLSRDSRFIPFDVNGDGKKKFIVSTKIEEDRDGLIGIRVIDLEGNITPWSDLTFTRTIESYAIGDLDQDGNDDVVFTVGKNVSPWDYSVYALRANGSAIEGFPINSPYGSVQLADIDRNISLEIILSGRDGIDIRKNTGEKYSSSWPYVFETISNTSGFTFRNLSPVIIGDVTGDIFPEFVFCEHSYKSGGSDYNTICKALSLSKSKVAEWPMFSDGQVPSDRLGLMLSDIDEDGSTDLVIAQGQRINVYELGVDYKPENMDWPLEGKDRRNSRTVKTDFSRPLPFEVGLASPKNGDAFKPYDTVVVFATATAVSGTQITKVEFFRNGSRYKTDTSPPYDGTFTPTGSREYTIIARATNSLGETTDSADVFITVERIAPVVTLTHPEQNLEISDYTLLFAQASDNVGMGSVQFQAFGYNGTEPSNPSWENIAKEDFILPYLQQWTLTENFESFEFINVRAVARDKAGNETNSNIRTVHRDGEPPVISNVLISPELHSATISWEMTGAERARVFYYKKVNPLNNAGPYPSQTPFSSETNVTITALDSKSLYRIRIEAFDAVGNVAAHEEDFLTGPNDFNEPLNPKFVTPQPNSIIYGPTPVHVVAETDGGVAKVRYRYQGLSGSVEKFGYPPLYEIMIGEAGGDLNEGPFTLHARACDYYGNCSDEISLPLIFDGNKAPLLHYGHSGGPGNRDYSGNGFDLEKYTKWASYENIKLDDGTTLSIRRLEFEEQDYGFLSDVPPLNQAHVTISLWTRTKNDENIPPNYNGGTIVDLFHGDLTLQTVRNTGSTDEQLRVFLQGNNGDVGLSEPISSSYKTGEFHHVVMVFDKRETSLDKKSYLKIWVDKKLVLDHKFNGLVDIWNQNKSEKPFFLGVGSTNGIQNGDFFYGNLSEIRIFNRSLSEEDVLMLYNGEALLFGQEPNPTPVPTPEPSPSPSPTPTPSPSPTPSPTPTPYTGGWDVGVGGKQVANVNEEITISGQVESWDPLNPFPSNAVWTYRWYQRLGFGNTEFLPATALTTRVKFPYSGIKEICLEVGLNGDKKLACKTMDVKDNLSNVGTGGIPDTTLIKDGGDAELYYNSHGGSIEVTIRLPRSPYTVVKKFSQPNTTEGRNRIEWDGLDDDGRKVSSGAYLVEIRENGKLIQQAKFVVVN